ncbi:hypothetical protein [Streptomyces sp. NPDC029003]|uniref:hypothetical protein n=1 Tax=Streptomyces sp. NPDC029003 TaxID=3155125 RepID=UPI0033F6E4AB
MEMRTWRDGWDRATDAAESLRAVLGALGLPESVWSTVRPSVAYSGRPYVDLGKLPADAVEQVAEALRGSVTSA